VSEQILIIGASKGIGLATVREALSRGHAVVGLARTTPSLADPRLTWIRGDARDAAILNRALAGATAVVTTLGVSSFGTTTLFSDAARAVTAAMGRAGVKRLVAVTGFGAGDSRGHGGFVFDRILFPLLMGRMYADKDREEAIIRQSGLDWSIVRPGRLTNGVKTAKIEVLTDPNNQRFSSISRADVASFLVDCTEQKAYVHQCPVIVTS
jgi:putative NADH-flavin reductase